MTNGAVDEFSRALSRSVGEMDKKRSHLRQLQLKISFGLGSGRSFDMICLKLDRMVGTL